jgi:hypothetical protein
MEHLKTTKCLMGMKAESMVTALAMPKFYLPQLSLIQSPEVVAHTRRTLLSRRYVTVIDLKFWNHFLKLFSAKEIPVINPYLESLNIIIRSKDKVIELGGLELIQNVDGLFKKNMANFQKGTLFKFNQLNHEDFTREVESVVSKIVEGHFYGTVTFEQIYEKWIKSNSGASSFFKLFVEDWFAYFSTFEGLKLWRHLPALYSSRLELNPTRKSVAKFIFNFIQPHFYLDERRLIEDIQKYLIKENVSVDFDSFISVIEESNKILHLKTQREAPVRSDFFWEFPDWEINPDEECQRLWSWKVKTSFNVENSRNNKLIFDFNDFILDRHYFTGICFFTDKEVELIFLQKFQHLFDKQLVRKIPSYFVSHVAQDEFWNGCISHVGKIEDMSFISPEIYSSFYFEHKNISSDRISWKLVTNKKHQNHDIMMFHHADYSYWSNFLFELTRKVWLEVYKATF